MQEFVGEQYSFYNAKDPYEPISKAVTDTSAKLLENNSTTKSIEELNESNVYVKALELLNRNEEIDLSLIRLLANLIKPQFKSKFRLIGDIEL